MSQTHHDILGDTRSKTHLKYPNKIKRQLWSRVGKFVPIKFFL